MKTLEEIGQHYCADKASIIGPNKYSGHHYTQHYERVLGHLRNEPIRLLEIGVSSGASILMWLEYFQKAKVFGIDNEKGFPETHTRFERIKEVGGDDWLGRVSLINMSQSDPVALAKLAAQGPFDVIVDDGSHQTEDIMTSLRHLFPVIVPGGFYVVEDMGCQEYNPSLMTTKVDFEKAQKRWYSPHSSCQFPVAFAEQHLDQIVSVQVCASEMDGHNLKGSGVCMIFIHKK